MRVCGILSPVQASGRLWLEIAIPAAARHREGFTGPTDSQSARGFHSGVREFSPVSSPWFGVGRVTPHSSETFFGGPASVPSSGDASSVGCFLSQDGPMPHRVDPEQEPWDPAF